MQVDELINKEVFQRGFRQEKSVLKDKVRLVATHGALPYLPGKKAKESDQFRIEAYAGTAQIGWVNFEVKGENVEALDIFINDKWRRKGIATEMYRYARELGNTVAPSDKQTPDGKALWASGKLEEDITLEDYRQAALTTIKQHRAYLASTAESVLGVPVKVKAIGSVTDASRFTESSDIDVGFYVGAGPYIVNEKLSAKLQDVFVSQPIGDLGVINTVVFSGQVTESATTLTEMASAVLYHYTSLYNAMKILQQRRFGLSASIGTDVERKMQSGDRWYFLSTARNKSGDYTKREAGGSGVVFNLNGTWLNSNYRSKAVDYWERMWLSSHDPKVTNDKRFREEEDRIFSHEPYIDLPKNPTDLITAAHVFYEFDPSKSWNAERGKYVRAVMLEAKRLGIPVFVYKDKQAWILQDTRRAIDISTVKDQMKGQIPTPRTSAFGARDDYKPYRELFYATSEDQLSPEAKKKLYNIRYYSDSHRSLENDLHNDRKAAPEKVVKFLQVMRQAKAKNVKEFFDYIKKKWGGRE